MKKIAFMLIHDFVAHPLIGLTGGSLWAWRLHDLVGEVATYGSYGPGVHITGKASSVADVVSALSQRGWQVIDDHIHGSDGRGQALLEPPCRPTYGARGAAVGVRVVRSGARREDQPASPHRQLLP